MDGFSDLKKARYTKKLNVQWVSHELKVKSLMNQNSICEWLQNRNKIDPFLILKSEPLTAASNESGHGRTEVSQHKRCIPRIDGQKGFIVCLMVVTRNHPL